ncbi:MAG: hypothetical protein NVS2B9_04490 [Myxococcales bacterium]
MNVIEQIRPVRRPPALLELPEATARRLRRLIGRAALAVAVGCGVVLAVDSASHSSLYVAGSQHAFPGWVSGPLAIFPGSTLTGGTYSLLTLGMLVAYLVTIACSNSIGLRPAVIALGILHAVFLLTPPLASTDIWNYIGYGHLGALHGLNPYEHAPIAARHDAALQWVTWPTLKTPYGPLFTILTYAVAPLGVAGGLWTLKALLTAAAVGCLALVWRLARRLGLDPVPAMLLVGLSPAWLIWTVGGAHNDVLMVLVALAGIALWLAGRDLAATFAIVIAAGIKAPAILLLPFVVICARDRRRAIAGAAAGAITVALASLLAFGSVSPLAAFQEQNNFHTNRSVIGEVFRLFSSPLATPDAQRPATIALIAAVAALIVWVHRTRAGVIAAAGWATAALLVTLLWEFPWYVSMLLPLAALAADRRLRIAALAITVVLLAAYVPPYLFIT